MKIAIVHSYYRQGLPSGENRVVDLQVEALRGAGHAVELFARSTDELKKSPFYEVSAAYRVSTGYGGSLGSELAHFKPDLVHVHNIFPNIGWRSLDRVDSPVVLTLHNYRTFCAAGDAMLKGNLCVKCQETGSHNAVTNKCYQNSAIKTIPLAIQNRRGFIKNPIIVRAAGVVVLSSRQQDLFARFGLSETTHALIPNFVPENEHRTAEKNGRWLWVGRLSREKGLQELLEWWPNDLKIDIVGQGPLSQELERGQKTNVKRLGPKSSSELSAMMPHYQGLIVSSLPGAESAVNLVHLEALASGIPVIARTPSASGDENITSGIGRTYQTADELSRALKEEASNPSSAETIRTHFRNSHAETIWVARIQQFYTTILEKESKR